MRTSRVDSSFDTDLQERLKKSIYLSEEEKQWLRVGSGLFIQSAANTYWDEIEEAADALIYLNSLDTKAAIDSASIGRMYYCLKCLSDAFRDMDKVSTKKD